MATQTTPAAKKFVADEVEEGGRDTQTLSLQSGVYLSHTQELFNRSYEVNGQGGMEAYSARETTRQDKTRRKDVVLFSIKPLFNHTQSLSQVSVLIFLLSLVSFSPSLPCLCGSELCLVLCVWFLFFLPSKPYFKTSRLQQPTYFLPVSLPTNIISPNGAYGLWGVQIASTPSLVG